MDDFWRPDLRIRIFQNPASKNGQSIVTFMQRPICGVHRTRCLYVDVEGGILCREGIPSTVRIEETWIWEVLLYHGISGGILVVHAILAVCAGCCNINENDDKDKNDSQKTKDCQQEAIDSAGQECRRPFKHDGSTYEWV